MHMPTMSSIVKEETIQENNEIDCKNVMVNNTNNNNEILPLLNFIKTYIDESHNNSVILRRRRKTFSYIHTQNGINKRTFALNHSFVRKALEKLAYKEIFPEISIQKKIFSYQ